MRASRVAIRSLTFYWKTGLLVAAGVAVGTAVVVGSLITGDSVRGSVRATALSRTGNIEDVLAPPGYFDAQVAPSIEHAFELMHNAVRAEPVIVIQGAVRDPASDAAIPSVNVIGADPAFWSLFPRAAEVKLEGRRAAVNEALARDLDVKPGSALLLTVGRSAAAPLDSLFAHRQRRHAVRTMRLEVSAVVASPGANFSLAAGGPSPRNLFVSRDWLAQNLGQEGKANALLVRPAGPRGYDRTKELAAALENSLSPADYGLLLETHQRDVWLLSRSIALSAMQVDAAIRAAKQCGATAMRWSMYLADRIARADKPEAGISYAVVAGCEEHALIPEIESLRMPWIQLNTWAEKDLGARVPDKCVVSYLAPRRDGTYETRSVELTTFAGSTTVPPEAMSIPVPDFEGVTNIRRVTDWDPPFPFDRRRVTKRDEEYWQKYRATPKALVPFDVVRDMWRAGGGDDYVTAVCVTPPPDAKPDEFAGKFESALRAALSPQDAGFVFRPVRSRAIEAAEGGTDFGTLFLAMSFFLVLAGAGLAGMLMRLMAKRRAGELGTLIACGTGPRRAARLVLAEGAALAGIGAAAGLPLGILYAAGVVAALNRWWSGSVSGAAIGLHVSPWSAAIGFGAGLCVGLLCVWLAVRRLARAPVLRLLSGWQSLGVRPPGRRARRAAMFILLGSLGAAGALAVLSAGAGPMARAGAFFGCGAALLAAGLAGCYAGLAGTFRRRVGRGGVAGLVVRSAAAQRGRSLLAVGLLACASFIIVTVAANQREFGRVDAHRKESGAGGFALRGLSSVPLPSDFGTAAGRANLGFAPSDEKAFAGVRVYPLLYSPGDDASCRNLARPMRPNILAASGALIERGGFTVRAAAERGGNPWRLLEEPARADGTVPAFGDADTVQWQLHSGLGGTVTLQDESGRTVDLCFVGLVSSSIFASELVIAESHFRRLFPSERSPRYFLVEAPRGAEDAVAAALRRNLGPSGLDVRSTGEILNDFARVQNTYLSSFLVLGGLGIVLGTAGLGVVLLRNAAERRGEFALLLAVGFTRRHLAMLLVGENALLLGAGLLCGTVAALAAVAPQLGALESRVDWAAVLTLLAGIIVIGLSVSAVAAAGSVRRRLIEALRTE